MADVRSPTGASVEYHNKYELAVAEKQKEIYAIQNRMYQLRFDTSMDKQDLVRDLKNLAQELKRLEQQLDKVKRKQTKAFQEALKLDEIRLTNLITGSSLTQSGMLQYTPPPEVPEDEEDQMKFMRTKSTETLQGQSSQDKWKSLFKMFKEWKHQTTVANAQYVIKNHQGEALDEEIRKVRSAVITLKNQKKLSETDQNLLKMLQRQLKSLMQQKQEQYRD
eukprot:TRINITY_DN10161_c0_g1_i1.p1 TRINITY_DN10161_c0_g1~~TRINITY_DN10161_c0_g1_i1.p1  ORF type:complete len:231 (-),score=82.72 TRINITY_DN10161_c0_g1_i1:68-730(-)